MAAGKEIIWACSTVLFGSFSATSGRWPTLSKSGLDTPVGVTTRTSRMLNEASALAVTLATSRFSSLGGGASTLEIPPASDSIETIDLAGAGGGTLVAVSPASPLKTKPATLP